MANPLRTLSSNYWVKLMVQNFIGLLPDRIGSAINLSLSNMIQGDIENRPTTQDYRILRSIRNIRLIRENTGLLIDNIKVLEFGTGWRAADAILFYIFGAKQVITVDHQRWLTKNHCFILFQ